MSKEFTPKFESKYNKMNSNKTEGSVKSFTPKYKNSKTRRSPKYGFEQFRSIN